MVLRAIWRSKIVCSDILRMPGENLGLAFPAFGVDGRTRGRQAINCAAFAADHEIFGHLLLPFGCTPLLLNAFSDDWRVRHTYKSLDVAR